MPIYEYQCLACGHELEAVQSMKDDPLRHCPVCDTAELRRRIPRGTAMIFKGTGFYETDYRRKGAREEKECPVAAEVKALEKPAGCAGGCACHGGN